MMRIVIPVLAAWLACGVQQLGRAADGAAASVSVIQAVTAQSEAVEILLSAPTPFKQVSLPRNVRANRPDRCYVDVSPAILGQSVRTTLRTSDGPLAIYVRRVRTGQFQPGTARVVLDLTSVQVCTVTVLTEPDRIAITVGPKGAAVQKGDNENEGDHADTGDRLIQTTGRQSLEQIIGQSLEQSLEQIIEIDPIESRPRPSSPVPAGSPVEASPAGAAAATVAVSQPAQRIDQDNMASVESLLTPSIRWMVERGMIITIGESKKVPWPRAYAEATAKFSPQVELSADGRALERYVAGAPFPDIDLNDPLAGFKIMWNTVQNPYFIDNAGTDFSSELINEHGVVEHTFASRWRRMAWTGRLYLDPKPTVTHNPSLLHTTLLGPMTFPAHDKGTSVLTLSYAAPHHPDDTYLYLPQLRRVRRLGIANRGEPVWGTDVDVDSFWGFAAKLSYWTFRVMAEKDILAVVHSGKYGDRSAWCAPRNGQPGIVAALPCVMWEKRRVWVLEATPTGYPRPYAYAKRVLYIDQDFYAPLIQEMYDQHGELWKALLLCFFTTQRPYWGYPVWPVGDGSYHTDEEWPFIPNGLMVDLQQVHATTFDAPPGHDQPFGWRTEWYFNTEAEQNRPEVYSTHYLVNSAR